MTDGPMPDYSEPLTPAERARNNPITAKAYKDAEENDEYWLMDAIESDMVRPEARPYFEASGHYFQELTILLVSIFIITLMVGIILL